MLLKNSLVVFWSIHTGGKTTRDQPRVEVWQYSDLSIARHVYITINPLHNCRCDTGDAVATLAGDLPVLKVHSTAVISMWFYTDLWLVFRLILSVTFIIKVIHAVGPVHPCAPRWSQVNSALINHEFCSVKRWMSALNTMNVRFKLLISLCQLAYAGKHARFADPPLGVPMKYRNYEAYQVRPRCCLRPCTYMPAIDRSISLESNDCRYRRCYPALIPLRWGDLFYYSDLSIARHVYQSECSCCSPGLQMMQSYELCQYPLWP